MPAIRIAPFAAEMMDRTGQAGYLETNRLENVGFYQHFGFETTVEILVLGVKNYLMV